MFEYRPVKKPSHARIKPTAKQRGNISTSVRKALQERSGGLCEFCGRGGVPLQAAHLIRRWKLDKTTINDICHLCVECHRWADQTKSGRQWLEQFRERLYHE